MSAGGHADREGGQRSSAHAAPAMDDYPPTMWTRKTLRSTGRASSPGQLIRARGSVSSAATPLGPEVWVRGKGLPCLVDNSAQILLANEHHHGQLGVPPGGIAKSWSMVTMKPLAPDQNLHSPMKRFRPSWRRRISYLPLVEGLSGGLAAVAHIERREQGGAAPPRQGPHARPGGAPRPAPFGG